MVRSICRTCCQRLDKKSRRTIFSPTFGVFQQLHEVLGQIPQEGDGHSRYVCSPCYRILLKLCKIDHDLIHKLDELRQRKVELIKYLRQNLTLDNIQLPSESMNVSSSFTIPTDLTVVTSEDIFNREDSSTRSEPFIHSPSPDANFSDVTVKLEQQDEEYEYSSAVQTEADSFTITMADPTESDESYNQPTVSQCPPQVSGGSNTSFSMPVISSPPIVNRALLNGGRNVLQSAVVPTDKQIVLVDNMAVPASTGTTIKQEVNEACLKLSEDGEESLFLSVNVEKKLCSYVGSDMGRQFLSKRTDIKKQFFKFCQDIYNAEKGYKTNETAMYDEATQENPEPKQDANQGNIRQQKGPLGTQQPEAGKGRETVPMTGNQLYSIAHPSSETQVPYSPPAAKTKEKQKRKITPADSSDDEPLEKKPSPSGVDKPFRKNTKMLNRGTAKSMSVTLQHTQEDRSDCGSNLVIIDMSSHASALTQQSRKIHKTGNKGSTVKKSSSSGENLKKVVKNSLREKSATFITKKARKMVKRTKKKPVKHSKNSFQEIKEKSESPPDPQKNTASTQKPCSFRQQTEKKRFGDDPTEDLGKDLRAGTKWEGEEKDNNKAVICQGNSLHQCDVCKDVFLQRQDLLDHVTTHTKTLPYICIECGKGFEKKWKLDLHTMSHLSHHPFQCDVCGMSFKMEAILRTHQKQHKELEPFKCNHCPLKFKSKEESRNHMQQEHKMSEKHEIMKLRVYKCEYCNNLFYSKDSYLEHVQIHSKEESPLVFCDTCGRSFTNLATLNVHKKTHLDKRLHCDICNFFFKDAHQLSKHFQTMNHKLKVEQINHIKHLEETRDTVNEAEETGVVDSVSMLLEEIDKGSLKEMPEKTQLHLGDGVAEKTADDTIEDDRLQ
ncbi:zinc finger protein 37-like isoform X2 [Saccostrea cucullata]|uniref:zinc finger protein 37-like isoform X2 n=1 Tax=Saccostrea cuccullata TaxID=36930 RepID=UPI002ED2E3C6